MSTFILETKTVNSELPIINLISESDYRNITGEDTLKFFRRLGGSETAQRSYTHAGYKITRLISRSPDRTEKRERNFKFYSLGYREEEIYNNLFKSFDNGLFYLKRFKSGKTVEELQKIIKTKLEKNGKI